MIDHENGIYFCDYCGGRDGQFMTATGNHALCQENAELKVESELRRVALADKIDECEKLRINTVKYFASFYFSQLGYVASVCDEIDPTGELLQCVHEYAAKARL